LLKKWLAHPLTCKLDIDDPATTHLRRQIIQEKAFLRQIYQEWYALLAKAIPPGEEPILELGAGAGFLETVIPNLLASELFRCPNVHAVLDGQELPFKAQTLRGIVFVNVLHHIPQPRRFFAEATRCVRPGGVIVMLEPWVTPWSRLIYTKLHHEPFQPAAPKWEFPSLGPLSGANGALPWLLFERDRKQFQQEFPRWQIRTLQPIMPFCYLLAGGLAFREFMPGKSYRFWRNLENFFQPWQKKLSMFAYIVLQRL